MVSERKVSYFYDPDPTHVHYGHKHPMKPHRMTMAHSLLMASPYWPSLQMINPAEITKDVIQQFHSDEYVDVLSANRTNKVWDQIEDINVEGGTYEGQFEHLIDFGIQEDCPIFETVWEFSKSSAAMSIGAATMLNHGLTDVAINWAGGLHHARMDKSSGFCFVNDIVLGILELLKYHQRVMYIDIDLHHGDGVEEAFQNTNRVLTVSFHKYSRGEKEDEPFFFPGTGDVCDIGPRDNPEALGYTVNVPLQDGISDDQYHNVLFKPIITELMERYQPGAIVLQSGADSVVGDKIGLFNLTTRGHAAAGRWIAQQWPHVALMLLGGGGYTISNVARTWAYETIAALGVPDADIPSLCYIDQFYWEHVKQEKNFEIGCVPFRVTENPELANKNQLAKLERMRRHIVGNIRQYVRPVSVPFSPVSADVMATDNMGRTKVKDAR